MTMVFLRCHKCGLVGTCVLNERDANFDAFESASKKLGWSHKEIRLGMGHIMQDQCGECTSKEQTSSGALRVPPERNIIKCVETYNGFGKLEDGFVYFWPRSGGAMDSRDLRAIADELDSRNADWEKVVEQTLNEVAHSQETGNIVDIEDEDE